MLLYHIPFGMLCLFKLKKPSKQTLLNLEGESHSVLIIYPTPKASQNEKTLNYHALHGMLALLPMQTDIHQAYP